MPDGVLALVGDELARVASQRGGALGLAFLLGSAVALWSANSGVAALFDALNVVYKEREKRSLARFYGTTFLFTLGAVCFVLAAVGAVVVLPLALNLFGVATSAERVLAVLRWPALLLAVVLCLVLVYRFGPSRRPAKWRWVTWGSAAAAALWVGVSMLYSWYVASFDSYNRTYGSLGAGVGFMTWIWLSVVVVLVGAELDAEMERQTAVDTTRGRPQAARGARGRGGRHGRGGGILSALAGDWLAAARRRRAAAAAALHEGASMRARLRRAGAGRARRRLARDLGLAVHDRRPGPPDRRSLWGALFNGPSARTKRRRGVNLLRPRLRGVEIAEPSRGCTGRATA